MIGHEHMKIGRLMLQWRKKTVIKWNYMPTTNESGNKGNIYLINEYRIAHQRLC